MLDNKNLLWLSDQQRKLDSFIFNKNNLGVNEELFDKKICAFFVELGEYANEEKTFKYWSQKPPSLLEQQLDEYVDGLHFLLSLGNDLAFNFADFSFRESSKTRITTLYFALLHDLSTFIVEKSCDHFAQLLNDYLAIAQFKNYSAEDLLEAYKKKNKINFQRQENNY